MIRLSSKLWFKTPFILIAGVLILTPQLQPLRATQERESTDDQNAEARKALTDGVEAYKRGRTDEAIEDFKKARDLDPSLTNAQLYLAVAYASQYIPGAPSPENIRYGE